MAIYDTKRGLLEAIAEKAGQKARGRLTWLEPYDEHDLEEIWRNLFSAGRKSRLTRGRSRLKKKEKKVLKHFQQPPETWAVFWQLTAKLRQEFGLNKAIPLHRLYDMFRKRGWMSGETYVLPSSIAYPIEDYAAGESVGKFEYGVRFCVIDYLYLYGRTEEEREEIETLEWKIRELSGVFQLHPALMLESIFCDIPACGDSIDAIIDINRHTITIQVRDLTMPGNLVRMVYLVARGRMVEIATGKSLKQLPRLRWPSDRVNALLLFMEDNIAFDWSERWKIWNKMYPHWCYSSPNSMRTVYYRAVGPKVYAQSPNEESD